MIDRIYNIMLSLLWFVICSVICLVLIFLLSKLEKFSGNPKDLLFNIIYGVKKHPAFVFAAVSILFLVSAYIYEINGNLKLAEIMGVGAYISFTVGVILKVLFLKQER